MHNLCPTCGTERVGALRFCRYCRFDFDAPGTAPTAPLTGPSPATDRVTRARTTAANRWAPARGLFVLVFAIAAGIGGLSTPAVPDLGSPSSALSSASATPASEPQVAEAPPASPPGTIAAAASPGPGPDGTSTMARVVRVLGGDTIVVAFGGKRYQVRYLGVVTAASAVRRATAVNAALVAGKTVVLEAGTSDTDRSGRLLRYVWVQQGSQWTLVNLELVRRGLAKVVLHARDSKYADRYVAAQAHARARHLGLWDPGPKAKPSKPPKPAKPPRPPKPSTPPRGHAPADRR